MSRRWRYPRARRGQFYRVPPAGAAPATPPPFLPTVQEPSGRNSRLVGMRFRRGRIFAVPAPVVAPPLPVGRNPRRLTLPRRGAFFSVPPAAVTAPAAAPWVPPLLHSRRPPARTVRRGEFLTIPLVGAPPLPPPLAVPTFTRERVRVLFSRRGHFWSPPYPQQQAPVSPWVPPLLRTRRPTALPPRRGEYLPVPAPRPVCPVRITSRRTQIPMVRRSRQWPVPRVAPLPLGTTYVPEQITASHRALHLQARRGAYIEPAWPQAPRPAYTPVTDPAATIRPNLATATPRANVATATIRANPAEAAP
jgi:hypothetical protein